METPFDLGVFVFNMDKPINLFIDTNIFLDFYHWGKEDLKELEKLHHLIKNEKVKLFITEQVIDEFNRNREVKIWDVYKDISSKDFSIQLPRFCQKYTTEYKKVFDSCKEMRDAMKTMIEKVDNDIENKKLNADKIVKKLFKVSCEVESKSFLELARTRHDLGNPPGKKKSYGDAINWEALLGKIPAEEDLYLISRDKDYNSPINSKKINSFLNEEWTNRKKSNIFFYDKLSDFFNDKYPDIEIEIEKEKDVLIDRLFHSGSFQETHLIIKNLSKITNFSLEQVKRLISVIKHNHQIGWIIEDSDVKTFYKNILMEKEEIIEKEEYKELLEKINGFNNGEDWDSCAL